MGKKKLLMSTDEPVIYEGTNTLLGGIGGTTTTAAELATLLGISESRIQNFEIISVDIHCYISTNYNIRSGTFQDNREISSYWDYEGKVTMIGDYRGANYGDTFQNTFAMTHLYMPEATSIGGREFAGGGANKQVLYLPKCTLIGNSNEANNLNFWYGTFNNCVIYVPIMQETSGVDGGINADILRNIEWEGYAFKDERYITNFTNPEDITDLQALIVAGTYIQVAWTTPTSVNGIDYYGVYVDGVFNLQTAETQAQITGLTYGQTYEVKVVSVDMFYNFGKSNVIDVLVNGSDNIPTEDIISAYKFENNVLDSVDGNDGIAYNITYVPAMVETAASFNGVSSTVDLGLSNNLSFAGTGGDDKPFTVSFLANYNALGSQMVVSRGGDQQQEWFVYFLDGTYVFVIQSTPSGANGRCIVVTDNTFLINVEHQVTCTYDGLNSVDGLNIYVDGILQTVSRDSSVYTGMVNRGGKTYIGAYAETNGNTYFVDGLLDAVKIWETELNQSEITRLATAELNGVDVGGLPLTDIISEYKFEGNTLDTVGENDGFETAIAYVVAGGVNQSVYFNGTSTYIYIGDSDSLSFNNGLEDLPFSISLLINFTSIAAHQLFLNKFVSTTGREYELRWNSTSGFIFKLYQDSNTINIACNYMPATAVAAGQWYHLTVTYDATYLSSGMKMYIDGELVPSINIDTGTYTGMISNTAPVLLGKYYSGLYFKGDMDCVRFWDTELDSKDIFRLAQDELNGIDINPSSSPPPADIPLENIVHEYKFENNVLDTVGTSDGTPTDITYIENGGVDFSGVFNGSTSVVDCGDADSLSFVSVPFSISFLLKENYSAPSVVLIGKSGSEWEYDITLSNVGQLKFRKFSDGLVTNRQSITSDFGVITDYIHIIVTDNGTNTNDGMEIYLNGTLSFKTNANVGTYVTMANTPRSMNIGGRVGSSLYNIDGNMDCVRFWDKQLSQQEAYAIATDELNGIDINP